MLNKSITMTLENVTFTYARVGEAQKAQFSGPMDAPIWNVQATAETGTEAYDILKDLQDAGCAVTEDSDGLSINIKQYATTVSGKENSINVYDADFNEMSMDDRKTVGDGSKGHVVFYIYESKQGMATRLTDVVVTDKEEFKMSSGIDALRAKYGK